MSGNNIILQNITREELFTELRAIVSELLDEKLQPEPSKEKLTKKEVCARLRISLPTLQRFTASGTIVGYRIGRRVIYDAAEVDQVAKRIDTVKYKRTNL
jgi:excisionase family DNA binding protein